MIVGIVGLGLIGGSLAKAYAAGGHTVYAFDTDATTLEFAQLSGVIAEKLTEGNLPDCNLLLLAVYPKATVSYLNENAAILPPLVIDCCGVKREICQAAFPLAKTYGFTFVGGHPMAGTHFSGFKYATETLFQGAPMVLVPPVFDDIYLLDRVKEALAPCRFGHFAVTTAEKHDEMIAFTSQLAHVVSNAYIKSPMADSHKGFSAGSYKDLTRVAWLNPQMWAELFLENKDNLLQEIDCLTASLLAYRQAIAENDRKTLIALLDEGRKRKEEVDGK